MADSIFGQASTRHVFVNGSCLSSDMSEKLLNKTPQRFGWGIRTPGTDTLALSILLQFTNRKTALRLYRRFEREMITSLVPYKNFEIKVNEVLAWLNEHI